MNKFDPRLLRFSIEVDGQLRQYTGLQMSASIMKFANPLQNQCTAKISNITKATRDYLLTETSPFNRPRRRKKLIIEAGRESTGYFKLYEGDIIQSIPSQPPDIELTLKASTAAWFKTDAITVSYGQNVSMSTIAQGVADSMGLALQNNATDKQISSYGYTGSKLRQVDQINDMGYTTFIDNDTLYVADMGDSTAKVSQVLDMTSGMVGIPEMTEQGIKVRTLLNSNVRIGSRITIKSEMNPAADGAYIIFKLGYDVANRDTAFYSVIEARREGLWPTIK